MTEATYPYPTCMVTSQAQERIRQLGTAIQAQRIAQNLSQDKLAKMIGTDQAVIARIEAGKQNTGIVHYIAIADALGVPLHDLIQF